MDDAEKYADKGLEIPVNLRVSIDGTFERLQELEAEVRNG